jgi:hypothetical protein
MKSLHRAALILVLSAVFTPSPVRAALESVIDEVMAGITGDGSIQYVEVRIRQAGQTASGSRFAFFQCPASPDSDPSVLISDPMPNEVANTGVGSRWLIATGSFAAAAHVTPDFTFTYLSGQPLLPMIVNQCGMVCWGHPSTPSLYSHADQYTDCVAYGGYLVNPPHVAANPSFAGNATPLSASNGSMSLTRILDTPADNATDFALSAPSPTNNAGEVGCFAPPCSATTTTTPGGSTTSSTTTTTFPPGAATPVAGTKLVLKTNPKNAAKKSLVILLHGANITLGDPVGHGGGSVRVFTTSGDAFDDTYPLPGNRWKSIAKGKGFKYVDPSGPIRLVIVKQGKMVKVTGQGGSLMDTLAANPDPVRVLIAAGTEGYCAEFAGGHFAAGKKYIAANSSPPASCP